MFNKLSEMAWVLYKFNDWRKSLHMLLAINCFCAYYTYMHLQLCMLGCHVCTTVIDFL